MSILTSSPRRVRDSCPLPIYCRRFPFSIHSETRDGASLTTVKPRNDRTFLWLRGSHARISFAIACREKLGQVSRRGKPTELPRRSNRTFAKSLSAAASTLPARTKSHRACHLTMVTTNVDLLHGDSQCTPTSADNVKRTRVPARCN